MKSREEIENKIREIKDELRNSVEPSFILCSILQALDWVLSD